MPSDAQTCFDASIPAAVFTKRSNSGFGRSTPFMFDGANGEPAFQQFLDELLARDRVVRRVMIGLRVSTELRGVFDGVFR